MRLNQNNVIRIQSLGSPQLLQADKPVRLYSSKVWALLIYLFFHHDQPRSRELLATLLWGEKTDKKARASLRQALYSIKQSVGDIADNLLYIDRDSVTFHYIDDVVIDVIDLLQAYEREEYEQVITLYKGGLLDGIRLSECEEYEAWLYLQRNSIEQKVLTALYKTVSRLIELRDIERALPFAQKLTSIDSLNEEGHRLLMRIHAMSGNLSIARHQYRLCVELLDQELGVEPTTETAVLFEQLDKLEQVTTTRAEIPSTTDTFSDLPLIQRDTELLQIANIWRNISDQSDNLITIRGEAGIGKSRLIREMVQHQRIQRIMVGQCFEMEINTPYSMWTELLQYLLEPAWREQIDNLESVWMQQVARIIPATGVVSSPDLDDITQGEKRLRLLQGIVRCLAHLASTPLLLVFEDIHWADKSSLELLHYATRQLVNYPILFIVTLRDEASNSYIKQLIRGLHNNRHDIELIPLNIESIIDLAESAHFPVPAELGKELAQFCGGNPYVLTETVRALSERIQHGETVTAESLKQVAHGVNQLVLERLGNIGEEHKRIVETVAIGNRPLNINLLRKVTGIDELRLLEYLDVLLTSGFLLEDSHHSSIEISHDYIRQTIIDNLRTVRKTALHRRIAETLVEFPRSNTDEIAYHFLQASDDRAISYLIKSAEQAKSLYAEYEAINIFQQALTFIQQHIPHDYHQLFEICLQLEKLYDQLGQRGSQANMIVKLEQLSNKIDSPELIALVHVRHAGLMTYTGQFKEAHQILTTALDFYDKNKDILGEANTLREMGFLQWSSGQYSLALEYNRSALHKYRRGGNVSGEATALHNLAEIHRSLNSPQQAINFYHQAEELYWTVGAEEGLILTSYGLGQAYHMLAEYEHATHAFLKAEQQCDKSRNQRVLSRIYHSLATLHWAQSQSDIAIDYLDKAVRLSREMGYTLGILHSLWLISLYHLRTGNQEQARHCMTEVIDWLKFAEDASLLPQATEWLLALDRDEHDGLELPSDLNWIRTHVNIAEGKVYCEFESPAAFARLEASS